VSQEKIRGTGAIVAPPRASVNPQPRRRIGTAFLESDDLVVFRIDQATGRLTTVGHQYSGGKNPRNFNIDPSGSS
jgi:hypothetical protein